MYDDDKVRTKKIEAMSPLSIPEMNTPHESFKITASIDTIKTKIETQSHRMKQTYIQ